MTNTANITKALRMLASKINTVGRKCERMHELACEGKDTDKIQRTVELCKGDYYQMLNNFSMLFDTDLNELEHMVLESMGFGHIDGPELLWRF